MSTVPTVGRIVHYTSLGSAPASDGSQQYASLCRGAMVTEVVSPDLISLSVFNPEGMYFIRDVPFDTDFPELAGPGAMPGHWHWPERTQAPSTGNGA